MWGKERKFVEAKTTHFQKRTSKAVKVRKELNIDSRLCGEEEKIRTLLRYHTGRGGALAKERMEGKIIYNNNHCLKGSRPPIPLNKTEQ